MPIYEYRCGHCDHEFEELVRSTDGTDRIACPQCGGGKVARKQSVFAAHQAAVRSTPLPTATCGRPECAGGQCAMMS